MRPWHESERTRHHNTTIGFIVGEEASEKGAAKQLPNRGMLHTAKDIVAKEGVRFLYAGLPTQMSKQIIYTGLGMNIYEQMRRNARM